jgi:type I restriction enzyme M protein
VRTEAVPEGKVADFLTGQHVRDTPEEYVRQNIEKALVRQYKYEPRNCEPEFPIKVGASRKRVDVVVFAPGAEHKQENAYILVETKRAGVSPSNRTEGIDQLRSYMAACLNVRYGLWTNGDEHFCLAKRVEGDRLTFEEIIEIPSHGQSEADAQRPKRKDLKAATPDNLLFAFRRCHNYIAGTEGKQKPEAFWELLKLIFCKIEDERSRAIDFYATVAERANATSAVATNGRIQRLFTEKVVAKYPTIFTTSDQVIDLKPTVVAFVVSQLQGYSLLHSPVDVKGVAYEEIVGSNLRGDRGEFFTPRNACRMAVTMLNPQPEEKLLDPACGTGGFLITAMNHVLATIERGEREQWDDPARGRDEEQAELHRARHAYLSEKVNGLDLNPGLVRAAKMNMVMNNDGSGGLWQANSLSNPRTWSAEAASRLELGTVDVCVSNPPFGANIVIDDDAVLEQYDLAAMWDRDPDQGWVMRRDKHGNPVLQTEIRRYRDEVALGSTGWRGGGVLVVAGVRECPTSLSVSPVLVVGRSCRRGQALRGRARSRARAWLRVCCRSGGRRRVRPRAWRTSRPGTSSSRCRRVAMRLRPPVRGSGPVRLCSSTDRAPASSPPHIHTVLMMGSAEGRWRAPAPSLASRNRSSMLVRRRNQASRPV